MHHPASMSLPLTPTAHSSPPLGTPHNKPPFFIFSFLNLPTYHLPLPPLSHTAPAHQVPSSACGHEQPRSPSHAFPLSLSHPSGPPA
ncbi:unnamed protein product [Chondrus crispus]|uniref:Uncharacterized protein n=1 Tax=Chondrus crispus TaxID=2769 RepID=R7QIG8_CHOCR|nr:unnamed protein product [Chondrus crispus]CDF37869.1 unnamed protein product [Chondrus crispus]|eukprot:XP_005717740.1 unnamed protein product [Chondrus crispus]